MSHLRDFQLGSVRWRWVSPQMDNPSSPWQISHLFPSCSSSLFTFSCLFVFIGTDALCWEQELYRAWSSSSWGLLFVHQLFCCSPVPPHCGVRQSSSCSEEASFVSTGKLLHTTSLVFKCLRANVPPASCWYFAWGLYSAFLYVSCIYVMCFHAKKNLIVRK